jgi:hypothetical protein
MIRAILSFAAGAFITAFVVESGSVKKFAEVAKEKACKVKAATQKGIAAAREEYCGEEADAAETEALAAE